MLDGLRTDSAHYNEAYTDSLTNLNKFPFVRCVHYQPSAPRRLILDTEIMGIRFAHLFMNCVPSRRNSRGMSAISLNWLDMTVYAGQPAGFILYLVDSLL